VTGTISTGFNRRVKLEWFERTAQLVRTGATRAEVRQELDQYLSDYLAIGSHAPGNARTKTIQVLSQCWVTPPEQVQPLRDDALDLWDDLSRPQHLVLHWGLAMAVYPFFGIVAELVGRLLQLQGSAGAAQVQRRLAEKLGERNTVARNGRYVLRTFADWGVLVDTAEKGVYRAAPSHPIAQPRVQSWLVEALLVSVNGHAISARSIGSSPRLFPFDMPPFSRDVLDGCPRIEIFRQGVAEEMVLLAKRTRPGRSVGLSS
jgi:hypothetical protein